MKSRNQNQTKFMRNVNECLRTDWKDILIDGGDIFKLLSGESGSLNVFGEINENIEEVEEDEKILEPLDLEEVMEAIENLKNNKASSKDAIPAELLKYGREDIGRKLYNIIWSVRMHVKMPKG